MGVIILLMLVLLFGIAMYLIIHHSQKSVQYQFILNNISEGLVVLDDHEKIKIVNDQLERMLNISAKDYIGHYYVDLLKNFHIENHQNEVQLTYGNRIFTPKVIPVYQHSLSKAVTFYDVTAQSSTIETLREDLKKLRILDHVYQETSSTLDVFTVRHLILDTSVRLSGAKGGFIVVRDNDDEFQIVEMVGDFNRELIIQAIKTKNCAFARVVNTLVPERIFDLRNDPECLKLFPNMQSLYAIPFLNSQNVLIGILSLVTDNPQRFKGDTFRFMLLLSNRMSIAIENSQLYKLQEQQLKKLQASHKKISELEEMKSDMIRIAAHDVRGPANNIRLALTMILKQKDQLSETLLEMIKQIEYSTETITKICYNILSLERIEQFVNQTGGERFELGEQVQTVYREQNIMAKHKKQQFVLHNPNKQVYVFGHPPQVCEAVSNLISNAIKYTPEEGKVDICLDTQNGYAVFEVRDTGCGVPDEKQKRLFQPFYRAITKETANIEGVGLGLNLVKKIIDHHHGEIVFHSEYGKGSTFGFKIPVAS